MRKDTHPEASIQTLKDQASAGDRNAAFALAEYYGFKRGDVAEQRRWVEIAARLGHPNAKLSFGVFLMNEEAWDQSERWLQAALADARAAKNTDLEKSCRDALDAVRRRRPKD